MIKTDICLINMGEISKTRSYGRTLHEPTMGLYVLSDFLESAGYVVDIADGVYQDMNEASILNKALGSRIVGFYCVHTNMKSVGSLASKIKATLPNILTVCGGPAAFAGDEIISSFPSVDMVVPDGSETVLERIVGEVVGRYPPGLTELAGIYFRYGGRTVKPRRATSSKFPARIVTKEYKLRDSRKRVLKIITSQGCTNKCRFCVASKWRPLCAEHEVGLAITEAWRRGIHIFYIADENFCPPAHADRATAMCRSISGGLQDKGQDVILKVFLEPESPLGILPELASVGNVTAFVGFESFSNKILNFLGKPTTRRRNFRFWSESNKQGINVIPGIISLHPFANPEELTDLVRIMCNYDCCSWRLLSKKLDLYPGARLTRFMENRYSHLLSNQFSPLTNPSAWNYAYDLRTGQLVMKNIEEGFMRLASMTLVQELYSMVLDTSMLAADQGPAFLEEFASVRSSLSKLTGEAALNLIKSVTSSGGTANNQGVDSLLRPYLRKIDGYAPNLRKLSRKVMDAS